jgi:hypothetical protein
MLKALNPQTPGSFMNKTVLIFALVFASPGAAQIPSGDPGAMSCTEYVKASKGAPKGLLGEVKTGDAEADASMAEMDQAILKVCTKNPKDTLREAMQKAIIEIDGE